MAKVNHIEKQVAVDVRSLLSGYLNICNRAMEENKDKFLYSKAKELNRMVWNEANFHTIVYDENPKNVAGEFTIHFNPSERKLSLLPPRNYKVAFSWKVPVSYLLDVVENRPKWYLENPVMLDWKWLTHRIRTGSKSMLEKPQALSAGAIGFALGATLGTFTAYFLSKSKNSY